MCANLQQIAPRYASKQVQLPTYTDNVALPAFTRCTAAHHAAIDQYRLQAGPTAANLLHVAVDWANGTDRRTPDRCIDSAPHSNVAVPIGLHT